VEKLDILSMLPAELEYIIEEIGQPKFRAKQLWGWLHQQRVQEFSDMANIPKAMRDALDARFFLAKAQEKRKQISKDGTVKFLFAMVDGALIESVLMDYNHGASVCISTQVGCRMGCVFCASAEGGLVRNLTAGEMCAQVYSIAKESEKRIGNIVLMGCGEPLDNLGETLKFLQLITHPDGMNIGARHITVSTCGLVPEILALAGEKLQITLAISLHAPTDDVRQQLMPIAKRYTIAETISACKEYVNITNRRITFEYALAHGINDSPAQAKQLATLLRGINCHVNLIPVNKARGQTHGSGKNAAKVFTQVLQDNRVQTTLRRSLGTDIDGACGQLRANSTGI